jgi:hypothetical protein
VHPLGNMHRFGDGSVPPVVGSAVSGDGQAHGEVVLSYAAAVAGNYSLTVTVAGEPFGTAQEVSVVAGPLALAATPATATGFEGVTAGGSPLRLDATAVDVHGNVRADEVLELDLRLTAAPAGHLEPSILLTHPGDGSAELTVRHLAHPELSIHPTKTYMSLCTRHLAPICFSFGS